MVAALCPMFSSTARGGLAPTVSAAFPRLEEEVYPRPEGGKPQRYVHQSRRVVLPRWKGCGFGDHEGRIER